MSGELMTVDKLQEQLELFYNTKVYPYLNGAAHDGLRTVGEIIPMHSETCPAHCLPCDGSTYNKADYPQLSALLLSLSTHSQYEVDGDNTKFKVPDYRGEFIRGTGTNSHTDQGNGANVGVHQDATELMLPSINLTTGATYISAQNDNMGYDKADASFNKSNPKLGSFSTTPQSSSTGTWIVTTSRPTNTSVLFCIVYENHYIDAKHNYSTQEHVVGTWIDGKPIYEKTITGLVFPDYVSGNTVITIYNLSDYDITNVDTIYISRIISPSSGATIPWFGNNVATLGAVMSSQTILSVESNTSILNGLDLVVTIQYTKTTDTV